MIQIPSFLPGPIPPVSKSGRQFWLLYLGYSALLCGIFAFLGFPKPHVDDPFYVGTAEHLARTGELYNPYARIWMSPFTPGKYFAQFPLYPFVLGAWMKVAGIGTASVLVFFGVTHFLCCLFAGWFVRRARLSDALFIFLPWMILSISQTQGFRGDIPGLCAFWIGAVCITYATPACFFAAALAGCAAVLLWPVLLGFICPVFAAYSVLHWKNLPGPLRTAWTLRQLAALLAGGSAAFLAFLFMIGFEWNAFLHDFLLVTSMRRPGGNSILDAFLGLSWARYDHFFLFSVSLLSFFFLYWALRPSSPLSPSSRLWVFETLVGSLLAIALYAVNTQLIYFFFWMAFFAVAADFIKVKARLEPALIGLLSFGLWIQTFYGARNFLPHPAPETESIAKELNKHPGAIVVFDEIVYRYLFDLQPPSNSLSWLCLRPAPDLGGSLADKKPDQIWVMAEKRFFPESGTDSNKIMIVK